MRHAHHAPDFALTFVPRDTRGNRIKKKGTINRRIIAVGKDTDREYELHATKGFRSRRR